MNILVCTLGSSWAVIPEIAGLLDPERFPLYRKHPRWSEIVEMGNKNRLQPADEIWVITTGGAVAQESLEKLLEWNHLLQYGYAVRVWIADKTDQLDQIDQVESFRELVFRVVLLASEQCKGDGKLYLSLAGGRKTMSADLQKAAAAFGCEKIFHVVDNGNIPTELFKPNPEFMTRALPVMGTDRSSNKVLCAGAVMPVVMEGEPRSELLDLSTEEKHPVRSVDYYVDMAGVDGQFVRWSGKPDLVREFTERRRQGGQLFGNYLASLARQESHENWRMLYRLPPEMINSLRDQTVTDKDREWIQRIPKADLHRHIGGCLDIAAQREVGRAVWEAMNPAERDRALQRVQPLLQQQDWGWNWPELLRPQGDERQVVRAHHAAALLVNVETEQLEHNLYGVTEPRVGLRQSRGFSAYELPGELTGSAILQHEAAIATYANLLKQQAVSEGLRYVELRGSPHKYLTDYPDNGKYFLQQLKAAFGKDDRFRFIVIADRRQRDKMKQVVDLAVWGHENLTDEFVVGLDLAGDEGTNNPQRLAEDFQSAFEACLPITIHAGEGESAKNIWEAAYHLHADRIGHGLTLLDDRRLLRRFRDRDICLELCPTSNFEVVGFSDPGRQESLELKEYPLKSFWEEGLSVTIATDNPGISRTTLTDEYLRAARMSYGSMTHWDVLAMIKQGFSHSFLDSARKGEWIKEVDAKIFKWFSEQRGVEDARR